MASRKDVADRAGVSVAVVSYVLNNRSIVKEETRRKVLEAVRELGYQPNQIARSLKTKKSNQIVVLVNYLGNPFEAGLLLHIEQQARDRGYFVFFQSFQSGDEEELKRLFMGRVDGILLLGQSLSTETIQHFEALQIPIVSVLQPAGNHSLITYIDQNWVEAMHQLVGHLKELGHKRIGFMRGGDSQSHYEVRFQAFLTALQQLGLSWYEPDGLNGRGRFEQASEALGSVLSKGRREFTALVCANDLMAAGALAACRQHGVRVPSEIAVAGCEDILMSSQTDPPLTAIRYPRRSLGVAALNRLLELLEGKAIEELGLTGELIIRQSTAASEETIRSNLQPNTS